YGALGGSTGRSITDNAPLRGGKGMLYEGGVRVPLIARWPGQTRAGATCSTPIITVDFYPTLVEIAGTTMPAGQLADGVSFTPLLRGRSLPDRSLFWHFPGYLQANARKGTWRTTPAGAVRSGDWKLIEFFEDGRRELYHTGRDLGETRDLASDQPDVASRLFATLQAWRTRVKAPLPTRPRQ
ncbi:MAG: sulfatase/phosphatase domain-containing protein, partial [Planctomycetaceae bacterium]